MNSVEVSLLGLLELGESPLYASYRWLGRRFGRDISMDEFCRLIINMLEQDYIQLWFVGEGDRTELYELPSDLAQRYAALAHTDPTFDPLGYSLTLGPKAVPESMPDWETDISFDKSTFLLLAKPSKQDQAFDQLARLFPDVRWVITDRAENSDGIRVAGRISPPEHRDA